MPRTAVVTGISRGIGRAIAQRLAEDGLIVVGCARTPGAAESAAAELRARGLDVTGLDADVTDEDAAGRVIATAVDRTGQLDVLVHGAGIFAETPFLELTADAFRTTIDTNLTGAFLIGQAAARAMIDTDARARGGGRIVNIASTVSMLAEADSADYCASKGGLMLLTQAMALDLAPHGIVANCVAPGYITTDMTAEYLASLSAAELQRMNPLAHPGTPEDVAHIVAVLCDLRTRFVTGATWVADGGQSAISPRPA